MKITRTLRPFIKKDLGKRMVFIGGPRQVGKTTLARSFAAGARQYFSWDDLADREKIKSHQIDPALRTVVLDEIHKYARWRMLLKGLFDKYGKHLSILVTGSARLDHFRKGGDSLFGRYNYFRLHPFTLREVDPGCARATTERLLRFGGFPEPYVARSDSFYRRWQRERKSRVVYQDLRDLDTVRELSLIELLVDALPSRVGSVFSVNSLKEDLEVSPNTVSRWIEVLEMIYYCYRVAPYGPPKIRAVKKSQKLYLWDWAAVESAGARFENLVAGHLLKLCHFLEDTEGWQMELRFLRDTDLREIDFVVIQNKKPLFAVECKTGERSLSKHIQYFRERTPIPEYYQVHLGSRDYADGNVRLLPFETFCRIKKIP
jgi:predicted AAA+ superfamily ATPase